MRKSGKGMKLAVSAAFAAVMLVSGAVNISAMEGVSAVFKDNYVDDGEWINDNRVFVGLDSPVIAMLDPS